LTVRVELACSPKPYEPKGVEASRHVSHDGAGEKAAIARTTYAARQGENTRS
jgi:hypothetical protein